MHARDRTGDTKNNNNVVRGFAVRAPLEFHFEIGKKYRGWNRPPSPAEPADSRGTVNRAPANHATWHGRGLPQHRNYQQPQLLEYSPTSARGATSTRSYTASVRSHTGTPPRDPSRCSRGQAAISMRPLHAPCMPRPPADRPVSLRWYNAAVPWRLEPARSATAAEREGWLQNHATATAL